MPSSIHQVVTFATQPFAGNPAFVVTLDRPRSPEIMQALCGQLREPILASLFDDGDAIRIDYWTPDGTHPGPGHSTHAAAWVVFNRLRPGASEVVLRLAGGGARTIRQEPGGQIAVDWPLMAFTAATDAGDLAEALRQTPREVFNSQFGIVAVLDGADQVAALVPDLQKVAALPSNTVIVTARAEDADFAIRVFAPKVGLPEDPICGTAHRILVPMWAARMQRTELVSHQLSPRGGKLYCRLVADTVTIAGEVTLFLEGTVNLPEA